MSRPPLPPFTEESAIEKVRLAEDGWNSRDPAKVALAYTTDTRWRNRAEFVTNREEAQAFLTRKWKPRARLPPDQGALGLHRQPHRGALRLRVPRRQRPVVPGLRQRELGVRRGRLMRARHASINEHPISEAERRFRWPLGRRPDDHPGLSHFGF